MKELSIEEKAKRYDEAKLRMSAAYNSNRCTIGFMNEIFPELAESEDERIRKEIMDIIDSFEVAHLRAAGLPTRIPKYLAWLEKQGEKKSVDDLTPQEAMDIAVAKCFEQGKKKPIEMKSAEESLYISSEEYNEIVDECIYGEPKHEWSEEDKKMIKNLQSELHNLFMRGLIEESTYQKYYNWLKSLKPQNWTKEYKEHMYPQSTWKPSEDMLEALYRVIPKNVMEKSEDEMLLDKLYQGLKYGKVLSKK